MPRARLARGASSMSPKTLQPEYACLSSLPFRGQEIWQGRSQNTRFDYDGFQEHKPTTRTKVVGRVSVLLELCPTCEGPLVICHRCPLLGLENYGAVGRKIHLQNLLVTFFIFCSPAAGKKL